VIGVEWFTLIDQARAGRYFEKASGENANSGIVSVADRPYRAFLQEAMKTNFDICPVVFGERKPFMAQAGKFRLAAPATRTLRVPRAPGAMAIDGRRDDWPGTPPELIGADRLVLLSAGSPGGKPAWHYANSPQQYPCQLAVVADPDQHGYTVEAAVPWVALDVKPADGATLLFDIAIDDSADGTHRLRQLMWNGIARNSSDRSQWGRIVLGN